MGENNLGCKTVEVTDEDLASSSRVTHYGTQPFFKVRAGALREGEGEHALVRL